MSHPPLEWLIIGGGVHGVHLAVSLLGKAEISRDSLRILDPAPALMSQWKRRAANTGMKHLRSPGVHHLDLDPWSLLHFGGANPRGRGGARGLFARPYNRPATALFGKHCDHLIEGHGLSELHIKDAATNIDLSCDQVSVTLTSGAVLTARRIILAIGNGSAPFWPEWARTLRRAGKHVHHVFEQGFELEPSACPERVAVVGAGISGAQIALRLAKAGKQVTLVARRTPPRHDFDSDPGWVGPKNMKRFAANPDPNARREMIHRARHRGSLPPDVDRPLKLAIQAGTVRIMLGEPHPAPAESGIALAVGDQTVHADALILATGFETRRPGGELLDELIATHELPCASCGYPVVDAHLRWHPSVFVTGPLAELELGPVSRNIAGARRAAERIVPLAMPRRSRRRAGSAAPHDADLELRTE